jgi:hypothetical protein
LSKANPLTKWTLNDQHNPRRGSAPFLLIWFDKISFRRLLCISLSFTVILSIMSPHFVSSHEVVLTIHFTPRSSVLCDAQGEFASKPIRTMPRYKPI